MEIKIIPLGTKSPSVSNYVADALKVLQGKKNIRWRTTPMGTVIEGKTLGDLFDVAEAMHKRTLKEVERVVTFIEIDDRKDKPLTMDGKLQSLGEKLKHKERD